MALVEIPARKEETNSVSQWRQFGAVLRREEDDLFPVLTRANLKLDGLHSSTMDLILYTLFPQSFMIEAHSASWGESLLFTIQT